MTPEPEHNEHRDLQVMGHRMVTEHGDVVGRVNDVLIDDKGVDEAWAVVSTGFMRSERFVPLAAAYMAVDGDVVVPYDKTTIKRAPRAAEHILNTPVRKELAAYYGTS